MLRFRILMVVLLVATSLGSVLATSASAGTRSIVGLSTDSVWLGFYHMTVDVTSLHRRQTSLEVDFTRQRGLAAETHSFLFDAAAAFAVSDDLAGGSLRTGELATAPGHRPDYGSIDMTFAATGHGRTTSIPCGQGLATLEERPGTLSGAFDFNTNTQFLGWVDRPVLDATITRITLPAGCGLGGLVVGIGGPVSSITPCLPGLFLVALRSLDDGRLMFLLADKFAFLGQEAAILGLTVIDPGDQTAPAQVAHSVAVFGHVGMLAASPSLDVARLNGNAGKPFLTGKLRFERTKPVQEHRTKSCHTTDAVGRMDGRMVAHFDVGGELVIRKLGASLSRSREREHSAPGGPASVSAAALGHALRGSLAGSLPASPVWRALAASL